MCFSGLLFGSQFGEPAGHFGFTFRLRLSALRETSPYRFVLRQNPFQPVDSSGHLDEVKDTFFVTRLGNALGSLQLPFEFGNPLVDWINEGIAALSANGTIDELKDTWLVADPDLPVITE